MTFGRKWLPHRLPQPSSAFSGLLREFHESTRHDLEECHVDHIQRPTNWHGEALQRGPRPIGAAARPPSITAKRA
eukprot:scaffold1363_cov30-Phaeocystis_antarctica.AAC.2